MESLPQARTSHQQQLAINDVTSQERTASHFRQASDAFDRLSVGPISAISAGVTVVFGIGFVEGMLNLRPLDDSLSARNASKMSVLHHPAVSRFHFAVRYGIHQVLPSVIWYTHPASLIASHIGFDKRQLYHISTDNKTAGSVKNFLAFPTSRQIWLSNLVALRGAVAGSILLSQVLSVTTVLQESRKAYSDKIFAGEEPPLECTYNFHSAMARSGNRTELGTEQTGNNGVTIRLAGRESCVTAYGMAIMGRRRLWPVFEDPGVDMVQTMVKQHATNLPSV